MLQVLQHGVVQNYGTQIFGGKQYGNEVVQSLFLGVPFIIGIILICQHFFGHIFTEQFI